MRVQVKKTFIEVNDDARSSSTRPAEGKFDQTQQVASIMKRQVSEPTFTQTTLGSWASECSDCEASSDAEGSFDGSDNSMFSEERTQGASFVRKEPGNASGQDTALSGDLDEECMPTANWGRFVTECGFEEEPETATTAPCSDTAWPQQACWSQFGFASQQMIVVDPSMQAFCLMTPQAALPGQPDLPREWKSSTTVMMRNLPNRYTQEMLVEEICNFGFSGVFDFLYLPIDPETNANKGYAFINFLMPCNAWSFKLAFEGQQMQRFKSTKSVVVCPATLQGLEANYAHYSSVRCRDRPLFLRMPQEDAIPSKAPSQRFVRRRGRAVGSLVDEAKRKQHMPVSGVQQKRVDISSNSSARRFCPFCGGPSKPEHTFCTMCGKNLATLDCSS